MASFTDQISQFNPYISRMPVIAEMSKVTQERQDKYDQGVQKIQGYIDNVAGMSVIKSEHKQYLQSKLNELGSRLKTVAAGDFSNAQLVNSVGGMAGQIVKDPTVQNAVYSTERVRKEQERLDSDIKAGKTSPQNEWDWQNKLNNWLSDGSLDSTFSGRYSQYRDIDKKLREVGDKVHEMDKSIEIPYRRDNNGNIEYGKDGKPIVDMAMLKVHTKGKPAEKLLENFYSSLDEGDIDQLRINGRYHYKDANIDTFKRDVITNFETKKRFVSDEIVNTTAKLQDPSTSKEDNIVLTARLNDLIKARDTGELDKQMNSQLTGLNNVKDLDGLKYQLYADKYLNGLASAMSYQTYEQEYKSNPYFQGEMQLKQLNATYDKMRQDDRQFMMTYAQSERKFAFEQMKEQNKQAGSKPIVTPDALGTEGERPTLATLDEQIVSSKGALQQLNADYASKIFTSAKDRSLSTVEKQRVLDQLASQYNVNPKMQTDNIRREYLEKRRAFDLDIAQKNNLYATVKKETSDYDKQVDGLLEGATGVSDRSGRQIYSGKDLYHLYKDANLYYTVGAKDIEGKPIKKFNANSFLARYKGTKLESAALAFIKREKGEALTPTEAIIYNKGQEIVKNYDGPTRNIRVKQLEKQSEILAQRMPEFQTMSGSLSGDNKVDMGRVESLIGTAINTYNTQGALDVTKKSDFDPSTINKWRQDPKIAKTLDYRIRKKYDGSAELVIQNGESKQVIPMNSGDFGAFFPEYAKTNPITSIKSMVLSSPNGTTNAIGARDATGAVNAYFSGYTLPGLANTRIAPLVRVDVEGSPTNDGGPNDQYQVRMYGNNNGTWIDKILNDKGYANEAGVQAILNGIGTKTFEDLLKRK